MKTDTGGAIRPYFTYRLGQLVLPFRTNVDSLPSIVVLSDFGLRPSFGFRISGFGFPP
jgi:hypothetical protein